MKIIFATYSNKKNNHLNRYQSSCFHNDIQPIILGKDDKFFSFKNKIDTMINFLNDLNQNDIVVFTDCWDVIILEDEKKILNKFLSFNVPILFSSEKNKLCLNEEASRKWIEKDLNYPFLNSGSYMGYVKVLKKFLNIAKDNNFYNLDCDQSIFYCILTQYPEFNNLDYKQKIFGNNAGCHVTNTGIYLIDNMFRRIFTKSYAMYDDFILKDNVLINKLTKQVPSILHCPGKNYFRLDYFAFRLGYSNSFINNIIVFIIDKLFLNFIFCLIFYFLNFYLKFLILVPLLYFNKDLDNIRRKYIKRFSYFIL